MIFTIHYIITYSLKNMVSDPVFFSEQKMCLWSLELLSQMSWTFLRELFIPDVLKNTYVCVYIKLASIIIVS